MARGIGGLVSLCIAHFGRGNQLGRGPEVETQRDGRVVEAIVRPAELVTATWMA